jgi:hypothetical protein
MSSPRHRVAAAALLVLALASACSDHEPEPPPIVWEGEHLRFGTDADDSTICAGTLSYLDGVVGHLGEVFGRPDAQVDYYWLPDGTKPYCDKGGDGCATDYGTFSRHVIHQHELVHAIRFPNGLYLPIEEGLAEAYGDDWDRFPVEGDIHDLLRDPTHGYIPGAGYGLAGHFVSYLEAAHGLDALIELDAATNYEGSFSQAEAAFQRVYGQSLNAEIVEYQADYPGCDTRSFRDKAFDCSRNVVAAPTAVDGTLDMTVSMACDDPAVLGPRFGQRWNTVTLDVTVAGRYHIVVTPVENGALELVRITRCDLSCFEYGNDLLSRTTGTYLNGGFCLEPAQYLFRFAIDEEMLDDYRLIVTRTDYPACD